MAKVDMDIEKLIVRGLDSELSEDEARAQFAEFIGGAINQGIQEASAILTALNALNPDVESMIETISSIINERLAAFAQGDT